MEYQSPTLDRAHSASISLKLIFVAAALMIPVQLHAQSANLYTQNSPLPFGVNGDWDWVNLINGISGWNTVGTETSVPQDASGWPMSDAGMDYDVRRNMPWRGPDAPAINEDIAGVYQLSFTGQATIVPNTEAAVGGLLVQNQIYDAGKNQTTADLVLQPGHSLLQLQFLNTQRLPTDQPGTGFTNMRLIQPGYPANTDQAFTRGTLNAYQQPFAAIRFLTPDAGNAYQTFSGTGVVTTTWQNRVQVTDAYQAGLASRNNSGDQSQGVAWEYMIMLANATHHDMWINIPDSADDDYVTQLANLILNGDQYTRGLDPDLHVYVEYSNEVWNFSFQQYVYNLIQADTEGITVDQRYIQRIFQIAHIFESVFGATNGIGRVRPVALWQQETELTFFNSIGWEEQQSGLLAKNVLYGVGEAPYYSASDTSTVDATFATMWTGSDATRRALIGWQAVATYYGLREVSYESGPGSLVAGTGGYVIRDQRMIPSIEHQFLDNWFAVGGDVANYYAIRGDVSEFGDWMLVEDFEHLGTPTYQAAVAVLNARPPAITAGQVLPFIHGQTASLDPSQRTPDIYANEAHPGSGLTIQQGSPNLYLLRAIVPGTYSLQLYGHASDSSASVNVLVDDVLVGTLTLGASDGLSSPLSLTLGSGFHGLSLVAATADVTVLPAGTGNILVALQSGGRGAAVPSAPSNLTATPGASQVSLSWATTATASSYTVERSRQSGGPYAPVATLAANTYLDSTVANGSTYYYVVRAANMIGSSAPSSQVSVFPSPSSAPSVPGSVEITSGGGDFDPFYGGAIAIVSWAPVTNAAGYNVYRSTDGINFTELTSSPQSGTQYTDLEIANGTTYFYAVTAVNPAGESAQSSQVTATPVETIHQPPVLSSRQRDGFVFLSWIPDPLTTPQFGPEFNVKRSNTPSGPFTTIFQTSTYNTYDFTAEPGKTYFYVVTATNGSGESAPSNEVNEEAVKPGFLGYESGSSDVPQD
jgi:fibronectin type 3 domain-containing protein